MILKGFPANSFNSSQLAGSFILAILLFSQFSATAAVNLTNLHCEYLDNPLGIDVVKPCLSWVIESDQRGEQQTAYQILVASAPELLTKEQGDIWNSGKVESNQNIQIAYGGKPLESKMQCYWKVRVWNNNTKQSKWSKTAHWSMGLLDPSDWKAKWIGFDSDGGMNDWEAFKKLAWFKQKTRLSARIFRRDFQITKKIKNATAYVCGLGFFDLYLNGDKIGDHIMDPALSGQTNRVFYVTFDVTKQLNSGNNTVGAELGNGRYFPIRGSGHIMFGYPKLLLQLNINYTDGGSQLIISDEQWKLTTQGPTRANNEFDGEEYDARMIMDGWSKYGFDDSRWSNVQLVKAPSDKLQSQMIEPIRVIERIRPVSITNPKQGTYVVDFGRVFYGSCHLKVKGNSGTKVVMRYACSLNPDGNINTLPNRDANGTDIYTLRGNGEEKWNPHFKGQGFRRVEITGFPGVPTLDNFEGLSTVTDFEPIGFFSCSNELTNKVFNNVRRTQQLFKRSIPVDASRDERQGWLGDPAKDAESDMWNFNVAAFYSKWLDDIRLQQETNGAYGSNSPVYFGGNAMGELVWESCITNITNDLYSYYGDKRIVEKNFKSAEKWMALQNQFLKSDITMDRNEYGDWCDGYTMDKTGKITNVDGIKTRYEFGGTSGALISTAYHYNNCKIMERFSGTLGKTSEKQKYKALADKIKEAFNSRFLDTTKCKYWSETQCSYLLPLAFGMVPDKFREDVVKNLVEDIMIKNKGHLTVGLVGMQWLMQTLNQIGHPEVAYQIVNQTSRPSWGYMISKGATTVWEKWDMDTQSPDMNDEALLILSGNLEAWFYQALGGINYDPDLPASKHIIIRPYFPQDLTWVKASHKSLHGDIVSNWQRDGKNLTMNIAIPANTTATVYIPAKDSKSITESGKPIVKVKGVKFLSNENSVAAYSVVSGKFLFQSVLQ